jgi:hypothetical protein
MGDVERLLASALKSIACRNTALWCKPHAELPLITSSPGLVGARDFAGWESPAEVLVHGLLIGRLVAI